MADHATLAVVVVDHRVPFVVQLDRTIGTLRETESTARADVGVDHRSLNSPRAGFPCGCISGVQHAGRRIQGFVVLHIGHLNFQSLFAGSDVDWLDGGKHFFSESDILIDDIGFEPSVPKFLARGLN